MDHVVREVKVVREAAGSTTEGRSGSAPAVSAEEAAVGRARGLNRVDLTLPGCWGAVIFAAVSFTPSLLPRGGLLQGIVCGITAAIGYGLGVLAAWIWRAFADRGVRATRPGSWRAFAVSAGVLLAVSFGFGQYWQYEIRRLMEIDEYNIALVVASPFVAVLWGRTTT